MHLCRIIEQEIKKRLVLILNLLMKLDNLVRFLDQYLQITEIKDTSWNGLQFEGRKEVEKVVLAVDAAKETFEKAVSLKANMVIVHHGHFWSNLNPSLVSWSKERIEILYKNKLSFYVCHLPLDKHKEVGNNAQILRLLGAEISDEFFTYHGQNIGWIGKFNSEVSLSNIAGILNKELKTECKILPFGKEKIKTVAVCSGGGGYGGFNQALAENVDLYITGDAIEIFYTAKDARINVIFAGHHATETVGLIALSEVLKKKFSLECFFLDLPTGL